VSVQVVKMVEEPLSRAYATPPYCEQKKNKEDRRRQEKKRGTKAKERKKRGKIKFQGVCWLLLFVKTKKSISRS